MGGSAGYLLLLDDLVVSGLSEQDNPVNVRVQVPLSRLCDLVPAHGRLGSAGCLWRAGQEVYNSLVDIEFDLFVEFPCSQRSRLSSSKSLQRVEFCL